MTTGLPRELELENGVAYPINWNFRDVLNLLVALNDPDAQGWERAFYVLQILYKDWEAIPKDLLQEAVEKGLWFMNGGETAPGKDAPKLMDWEQDFPIIIPAVNRVAGSEVRELPSLHWWTFLGYYQEIGGDCTFAQIVGIRDKLRRKKPLEKEERAYYERNRHLIDLKPQMTSDEEDFIASIVKKKG